MQCSAAILICHKTFRAPFGEKCHPLHAAGGREPRGHKQPKQNHQLVTVHDPFPPHLSPRRSQRPSFVLVGLNYSDGVARHLFSAIFQLVLFRLFIKVYASMNSRLVVQCTPCSLRCYREEAKVQRLFSLLTKGLLFEEWEHC